MSVQSVSNSKGFSIDDNNNKKINKQIKQSSNSFGAKLPKRYPNNTHSLSHAHLHFHPNIVPDLIVLYAHRVNKMLYCKLNFLNNLNSIGACVNLVILKRVKIFTRNKTRFSTYTKFFFEASNSQSKKKEYRKYFWVQKGGRLYFKSMESI